MKNKEIIAIGVVGIAALMLFGKKGSGSTRMFTIPAGVSTQLPQGGQVPENQLPQYGFVQYQGQWYHQTQFQAPAGTDTSSASWMNTLQNALATGQQLFVLSGGLASSFLKTIKSTAVDWNNSQVNVQLNYGYLAFNGPVNPTTTLSKAYQDTTMTITTNGQQSVIRYKQNGVTVKEATIDFYNERLIGFGAGSVGLSGVYLGATYSYAHPKALTLCNSGYYSDETKGACAYHGGASQIKINKRTGQRIYEGKRGSYVDYNNYRKKYKSTWAKQNSKKEGIITL